MKKQKRNINEAFFIVTLVLIVILSLILIIKQLNNEPEFKITKETCSEDLNSMNQNTICQATCLYGVSITLTELEENELNFSIFNFSLSESINKLIYTCEDTCLEKSPIIETCEQVEVDKLMFFSGEYNVLYTNDNFCKEGWFKNNISSYNETSRVIYNEEVCFRESLHEFSKEDLTIDWLEENCEVKQFDRELSEDELKDVRGIYQCQEYEVRILK